MGDGEKLKIISKKGKKYPTEKSLQNLIPVNTRSKKEQWEIRSKGGKALKDSPKAKIAARLREMRKNGLTDDNSKWLYNMMMDSDLAAMQILEHVQELLNVNGKPIEMNAAVKTAMDWYKIKHGSSDSAKIQIQMNTLILTTEEKDGIIDRMLG